MDRISLYKTDLIALLAGIMLPFAFSPFNLFFLAFTSPGLLLFVWNSASPLRAMIQGFLFGFGFFSVGVSWIYISVHVFGQAPIPLAVLITVIFISYLSLFFAAMGYVINTFSAGNSLIRNLIAFPCLWIIAELVRTWLFSGFPWLLIGYSQTNTWLKGFAPFFGVYGLSLITISISGALVSFFYNSKKTRMVLLTSIGVISISGLLLSQLHWTKPSGKPLRITMVQGNIDQDLKWQPEQIVKTLALYSNYTARNWSSDLIIWPEAAVTLPLAQAGEFINKLSQLAKAHHSTVITGIPVVEPHHAYNAMISVGNGQGIYYKRHLVPFGEYTPLKSFFNFILQAMHIPMSDFTPGTKTQIPLLANGIAIAPYICYEVAYPVEFLTFLPEAKVLLTITDDSWFGHSIASAQHIQMAQFRALETGRYLLFSSNTGVTAVLSPMGTLLKSVPSFQEMTLTAMIYPMEGKTPWMEWKLYPLLAWLGLGMLISLYSNRKQ